MKLHVLGCHGGELPKHRTTCFLIDGVLAIDAGSLCSTLSIEELEKVEHVVLTHSHLDHVKDLPLMADLLVGRKTTPINVHCSKECEQALRKSVFNDSLWPDFTRIPDKKNPMVKIHPFKAGAQFALGAYTIQSVPVTHPVESCGFVVTKNGMSIAISGDTGPTQKLWQVLNEIDNLKALLLETSFPNRLQSLATLSGHLTPNTLKHELLKFKQPETDVFLYHLKPGYVSELKEELSGLKVTVLELGDTFEF